MSALVLAVVRIRSPSTLTCNKRAPGGGDALGSGGVELGAADGLTDAPGVGEASAVGGASPKTPIASPTATPTTTTALTALPATRRG